jgi:hypothetical protein
VYRKKLGPGMDGERGQVVVMVALMIVPLCLLVGLAVDLGVLFYSKAKLQRTVDAAALSAAESFYQSNVDPQKKTQQFLAANLLGAPPLSAWSMTRGVAPDDNQLTVSATQPINTLFMRIIPAFATVSMSAQATAVLDSYAELPIKPVGNFGKEGQVNPSVFGPNGKYSYGDAYSPSKLDDASTDNPDHSKLPYGYLFRIYVPPDYTNSQLKVEIFDPDCYNADLATNEPHYLDPPTNHVTNPDWTADTTGHNRANAYIILNKYGAGWHKYFRVDEIRSPAPTGAETWDTGYITTTQYTLWHFRTDQVNLNPFADPSTLSDQTGGAYIARATYGNDSTTDLKWISPSGFTLTLANYDQESADNGGGWSFYLYVQSTGGSSENGFDIRTGPPGQSEESDVNDQMNHTWNSDGSMVFTRRAYPFNNNSDQGYVMFLTQVPESAAGSTLLIRHFDNDADRVLIPYYLVDSGGNDVNIANGKLSGSGTWFSSDKTSPDAIQIPARGTALYNQIFPAGVTSTWLKARYNTVIPQDSSVWELLYIRPRLLR